MTRAELLALAARVEAAQGADRELDALAALSAGWQRKWNDSDRPHGWYWKRGDYSWTAESADAPPAYTASLDAALTLVPEGNVWTVATWWCEGDPRPPYYADCASGRIKELADVEIHEGRAATPALALTAAALRARAEELTDDR